jgi:MFS family permease
MQATRVQSSQLLTIAELRTLSLASLGGALEFYDFIIFVFFTAVIGKMFFPASLPDWMRQIQTFGIFAAGFLARPLGGIVMAHFSDIRGRKRMFTLSVLLMAIPTLLIGFLPTYRSIGVVAPLLLLAMRVMQGIAIGGEAPGGWVFVAEHARRGQVGFAVGLLTSGLSCGILLGSLVATGLNMAFSQAQIASGFWRVPFIIGGVFGFSCCGAGSRKLRSLRRCGGARRSPRNYLCARSCETIDALEHLDGHGSHRGRDSDDAFPTAELVPTGAA